MKSKTLILLYNLKPKNTSNHYPMKVTFHGVVVGLKRWILVICFFVKKWVLRLRLENKFRDLGLKLKWKRVLVFDGVRGVV